VLALHIRQHVDLRNKYAAVTEFVRRKSKYVIAFEATSALLITAAVGAMILAHVEKRKEEKVSQPERMLARFRPGNYPAPKPGPGVFAGSDSVATPARLPDGTPSERSISKILPTRELTSADVAPKGTEK